MPRLDQIIRAFETIKLLQERPITASEFAEKMDISLVGAYRWIDACSCALPVVEIECNEDQIVRRPPKLFYLPKNGGLLNEIKCS